VAPPVVGVVDEAVDEAVDVELDPSDAGSRGLLG
jgi:hypothetical protein